MRLDSTDSVFTRQFCFVCFFAILTVVAVRASTLWFPLLDNTEGRYGSISLAMFESGDWITPQVRHRDEVMPFWGKPPLAFWMNAASFQLFGVSEWSARLPGFLCGLLTLGLVFLAADHIYGRVVAYLAALVGASSALFLGLWGMVNVDGVASLAVTGVVVSFILMGNAARRGAERVWGLLFFSFLGLGMLAKGPITIVLSLGPVFLFCVWAGRADLLRLLPWFSGLALFVLIAAPWYVLAERATPGFLEYFFVHEHVLRFLSAEYGDLYGKAHVKPYGTIWLMLFLGMTPWWLVILARGRGALARVRGDLSSRRSWSWILVFWGLAPAVFFTIARSVIVTYALPGIGGLAILTARDVHRQLADDSGAPRRLVVILTGPLLLGAWGICGYAVVSTPVTVAVTSLAVALVLTAFLVSSYKASVPSMPVVALPVAIAAAAVSGCLVFADFIGFHNSTKEVMRTAHRELSESQGQIVVLGRGEPSMDFYGGHRVAYLKGCEDPRLPVFLDDGTVDLYLIRVKNADYLAQTAPALVALGQTGRFAYFSDSRNRTAAVGGSRD